MIQSHPNLPLAKGVLAINFVEDELSVPVDIESATWAHAKLVVVPLSRLRAWGKVASITQLS